MKKTTFLLTAVIIFVAANLASAHTIEVDPATPLDNYVTFGEWNTDGDLEGWTSHDFVNVAAYDGSLTGTVSGVDPQIQLNIAVGNRVKLDAGSIIELRIKYDADASITNTTGQLFFYNSTFYNVHYADYIDLQIDGNYHVYRVTLSSAIPSTDRVRIDPLGSGYNGNTFAIDYIRMKLPQMIDPIDATGEYFGYTSLADWNTDGDYENWSVVNMSPNSVFGGYLTATNNNDGQIYKQAVNGLPAIDLDANNIVQVRMKREINYVSDADVFFGTANNPGVSGARQSRLWRDAIPGDDDFHIYRYDLSVFSTWEGTLQTLRFDPSWAANQGIEIDYIRIGKMTTEPTQVSNIVFDDIGDTSIDLAWGNGNGDGRLIVCREGETPSSNPIEGTDYTANSTFTSGDPLGDGYVVYKDTGNSVTIDGLTANTEYYFQAFEYNSSDAIYYNTDLATGNPNFTTTTPEPGMLAGVIIFGLFIAGIKR